MAVPGLFLLSRMELSQPGDNQVLEKWATSYLYTGGKLKIDCKLALPDAEITEQQPPPISPFDDFTIVCQTYGLPLCLMINSLI